MVVADCELESLRRRESFSGQATDPKKRPNMRKSDNLGEERTRKGLQGRSRTNVCAEA